jgi:hypothetical protein
MKQTNWGVEGEQYFSGTNQKLPEHLKFAPDKVLVPGLLS